MWIVPYLLEAMADRYPSSRRFAQQSLARLVASLPPSYSRQNLLAAIAGFDFIADPSLRTPSLAAIHAAWQALDRSGWPAPPPASGLQPDYVLPPAMSARLNELGRRQDKQISIGE